MEAFAGATRVLTQSKEVMDSVMTAKLAKAEAEAARRAALAEFNSKANRDLRKRLAARGIGDSATIGIPRVARSPKQFTCHLGFLILGG